MINTTALKARLTGQNVTFKDLADSLNVSEDQAERMISGEESLTLGQAERISTLIKIPDERFSVYFFNRDQDYSVKE